MADRHVLDAICTGKLSRDECLVRLIALEELAKHKSEGDAWVAIHDRVYDVTKFLRCFVPNEIAQT